MMLRLLRLSVLAVAACAASVTLRAQETLFPRSNQSVDVGIVYDREVTGTLGIHTNGLYAGFTSGKLKTYYKTSYWGANIGILKSPRETRSDRAVQFGQNSGSYVYGKRSTLIPVRAVKGWKRYYSGKDRRRGVAVGTSFELGLTAGVVKPYVLEISGGAEPGPNAQFFTYAQNPDGFTSGNINGTGGLKRGWSEASIIPGVNAKAAIHLDWGAFDEFVKAMEVGIMVDAFPRAVPLLIEPASNSPLFVNFFINVHLGKRR